MLPEDSEEEIIEPVSQIDESVDTPEDPASFVPVSSEVTPQDLQLELAGAQAEEQPSENYYGVRPELRDAVIDTESSGNPNAIGPETRYGRAKGLMQVLDDTGAEQHKKLGIKEPYDPFNGEQNKTIGTAYLGSMIEKFGSEELGLAAYNWGPGNLKTFLDRDENKGKSYDEIKNRLPSAVKKYVKDNIEGSYGGDPRARAKIEQDDSFKPPLPSQVPNTQGGFAEAVGNLIKAPEFDELPLNDKVSRIGKIYGLHKNWGPGTGEVLKEVISNYTAVAPYEERPVLSEIIGPTPIVPTDTDPSTFLKSWEGRRRQELIREGINPDFFGKQFDEYFAREIKDETEAHTIRNRSFIGTGINRAANAVRDAAKGVTSIATVPVAAVARLGTAGAASEFANSVESIPDKLFGTPANDYLFEVGPDGRPLTNSDGTFKLKMYSGIFQGIGMMGAQMAGGLALKGVSTLAKALPFITSNTLYFSNEIFRDTFERTKGDASKAYLASTFALPAAAIASVGQLATVAKWANPALEFMSVYNKGKYLSLAFAKNAGIGAVTQGAANVVKQAGQNVVTDRPFDSQELKQNIIAGAVVQGLTGVIHGKPGTKPSPEQKLLKGPDSEQLRIEYKGTPSGDPIEMPAGSVAVPKGPLALSGRETPLLLSGPKIVESDYQTSPIQLHAGASEAEQRAVTLKLEAFQNYWGRSGTLTVEEASKIPPELMEVYGNTATTDGKNVIILKKDSYTIVDSDVGGLDKAIGKVQEHLAIAPTPDEAIGIGAKLKEAEIRLEKHVEAVGKSTESYVRGRKSFVKEVRKREEALKHETDEDLRQIRREDLREAREGLDAYDLANDANSRVHAKTQVLADEVDLLKRKQDIILDPYYHNNLTAAYKNLVDLRNKRNEEAAKATAKNYEEYAQQQLTRQAVARVTGVDFERPMDLSKGLSVEGGYIIPHDNKFYVLNNDGKLQSGGHIHYKDAINSLKAPAEKAAINRDTGFIMKERQAPDRTRLSEADEIAIREEVKADEAERKANEKLSKKEYRAEGKSGEPGFRERQAAREKARKEGKPIPKWASRMRGKAEEGVFNKTINDPDSPEIYNSPEPVVDYGAAKPAPETLDKKVLEPDITSKTRRLVNEPSRKLGADYTPLVEFKEDSNVMVKKSDIKNQQQKLLSMLNSNLRAFYGGSLPRNVLGQLNALRGSIKIWKNNDTQTNAHELFHAVDQYLIGRWGINTIPDYSKLPMSVVRGVKDTADVFKKGLPEELKMQEGFAYFFENYVTGQPVNREVLSWFKGTFAKEHPEVYKALESIKDSMFGYYNQTSELAARSQYISKKENKKRLLKEKLNLTALKDWQIDRMAVFTNGDALTGGKYRLKDMRDATYKMARGLVTHLKSNGRMDLSGNEIAGESMDNYMKPINKSKEKSQAYFDYATALHRQARRLMKSEPGGNETDDAKVIANIQNNREMADVVRAVQSTWEMNDFVNNLIRSASSEMDAYITKREQENLATTGTTHGYYLPAQRGGHAGFNPNKKRTGSTSDTVNPFENLLDVYTNELQMAYDSRFREALVASASGPEASHIGMLMREITGKRKEEIRAQQEAAANSDPAVGPKASKLEKLYHAITNPMHGTDQFEIFSYLDGKDGLRIFEVNKRVNEALKDTLPEYVNTWWFKGLSSATPIVRTMATVARFGFVARNAWMDNLQLLRYIQSQNPSFGGSFKDMLQLEMDVLSSFKDIALFNTGKDTHNWAARASRLGLSHSNRVGAGQDLLIDVQKAFPGHEVLDVGRTTLSKLENFMSGPENAFRLASMKYELRRLGVTDPNQHLTREQAMEAILAYKRGTTNYQIQGSGARVYNLIVPFYSARLANMSRIPNDYRRNPGKTAALLASTFAYGIYHALAHKDDEWYKELEPNFKMGAIAERLTINGIGKVLYAPLDNQSALAFGLGTAIALKMSEDPMMPVTYTELAKGYFGMMSPISNYAEVLGPAVKEAGQQIMNRDVYFMRDIVPPSLAFKDRADQYNENTTEFSKKLGSLLGWSPLRIDHFLGSITPAVRDYLNIAEKATGMRGAPDDSGINIFLNAFAKQNSAEAVMDVSNRLFTEKLMDFRANMAGESSEEEMVRKSLERINQNVSVLRSAVTLASDQKDKDEIRVRMRDQLQEGLRLAKEGATSIPARVPEQAAVKAAKKAKKQSVGETKRAAREESGAGTLIGSTD